MRVYAPAVSALLQSLVFVAEGICVISLHVLSEPLYLFVGHLPPYGGRDADNERDRGAVDAAPCMRQPLEAQT